MALMDLIGLGADKQAVIIDIGSMFTKVGFAGEYSPRHIIRSEIIEYSDGAMKSIPILEIERYEEEEQKLNKEKKLSNFKEISLNVEEEEQNQERKYKFFKDFFHMLYFKYLLVNPKERRVVICESMFKSINTRNVIADVLFKHFHIVSIVFVPSHLLALYSCGVTTGLVVDCGYLETSVVPIYEQVPVLKAIEYVNLAGKAIHKNINKQIMSNCLVQVGCDEKPAKDCLTSIDEAVLEDIKIRCCFVGRPNCDLTAAPVKYPLDGNKTIYIDGKMRSRAFDLFFEENDEDICIPTCICDAILNSPIDCRKELAGNIILIGGGVMSDGFAPRLLAELKKVLKSDRYKNKLFLQKLGFRKPLMPANYCAWQGGALFGALEILSDRSISRERYHMNPLLPDWSSTLDVDESINKNLLDEKYKLFSYRKALPLTPPPASSVSSITSTPLGTTTTASVTERLKREFGLSKPTPSK